MNTLLFLRITIVILIFFTLLGIIQIREGFNRVNDNSVINFLRYPGEQKFCPYMPNNLTSRVFNIPDLGFTIKLCCSSCFNSIMNGINNESVYSIRELTLDDIDELERYHIERNLEFSFPNLNQYLGRVALFKNNMPVQLLSS